MRAMRGTHQSSVLSEMSSQFHDEWSAVPGRFCIDRCGESASARRNFVFGPDDVDDRVQADGLGDDAAPAGVERAHDVRVRFGRRRRRQQERVLEAQAGERRREVGGHLAATLPPNRPFDQPKRLVGRHEHLVRVVQAEGREIDQQMMAVGQAECDLGRRRRTRRAPPRPSPRACAGPIDSRGRQTPQAAPRGCASARRSRPRPRYVQSAVIEVARMRSSVSGSVVNASRGKPANAESLVFITTRSVRPGLNGCLLSRSW